MILSLLRCTRETKSGTSSKAFRLMLVIFAWFIGQTMTAQQSQVAQATKRASPEPSIAGNEADKIRQDLIREATQHQDQRAAIKRAEGNWIYFESADQMGRGVEKIAEVKSSNAISLGFPYEGEQHGVLVLRKSPRDGKDAILQIERGQFMSSFVQNFVTVRFDKGELQKFVIGDSADGSSNVLFIRHYDRFVSQLRNAKTVKIEANFYREGSRVFEFDVHGLRSTW